MFVNIPTIIKLRLIRSSALKNATHPIMNLLLVVLVDGVCLVCKKRFVQVFRCELVIEGFVLGWAVMMEDASSSYS